MLGYMLMLESAENIASFAAADPWASHFSMALGMRGVAHWHSAAMHGPSASAHDATKIGYYLMPGFQKRGW
jgi:hypothetical protein